MQVSVAVREELGRGKGTWGGAAKASMVRERDERGDRGSRVGLVNGRGGQEVAVLRS